MFAYGWWRGGYRISEAMERGGGVGWGVRARIVPSNG